MTDTAKVLRAIALGLLLATFPYLHWIAGSIVPHTGASHAVTDSQPEHDDMDGADHAKMHGDHDAHHGGQLGMAGDYHLEFVVVGNRVEVHASDARRKPLTAVGGNLDYGDGIARKLRWRQTFLEGPYVRGADFVNATVVLDNGGEVEIEFWLSSD